MTRSAAPRAAAILTEFIPLPSYAWQIQLQQVLKRRSRLQLHAVSAAAFLSLGSDGGQDHILWSSS